MKNKTLFMSFSIIIISFMLFGCKNETKNVIESNITETTEKIEIIEETQEIITNMSDDELIKNALLKHYDKQFGYTDALYKTTGYKIYTIEDIGNNEKKAYGFANYMEYNIENGELINTAGSGPTGIIITFSKDGKNSKVNYEILTESDYKSDNFKNLFPKDIQEKILKREQKDIDEVTKTQEDMLKNLMK